MTASATGIDTGTLRPSDAGEVVGLVGLAGSALVPLLLAGVLTVSAAWAWPAPSTALPAGAGSARPAAGQQSTQAALSSPIAQDARIRMSGNYRQRRERCGDCRRARFTAR
jgi:hypothetical protein